MLDYETFEIFDSRKTTVFKNNNVIYPGHLKVFRTLELVLKFISTLYDDTRVIVVVI